MIVVGIDPGLSGAVARLIDGGSLDLRPVPLLDGGKRIDPEALCRLIADADMVVMEKVNADPSFGAASSFTFGRVVGSIQAVIDWLKLPCEHPAPRTWRAKVLRDTPQDKAAAVAYVQQRWPGVNLTPPGARKPSHDFAEAACLAEYGRRLLLGELSK